jgi:large subunit ribosomal protein L6
VSRVGLKPIVVPEKVQVTIKEGMLSAKGPKGELSLRLPEQIEHKFEDNNLTFSRNENNEKHVRALHGLTRALAFNVIEGVTNGFKKTMIVEGVGFKVEQRGKNLLLSLGFSHPVFVVAPNGIELTAATANQIVVSGIDKQLVGQIAAKIRSLKKPEPYKGKGIRYEGEYIRRKAGKTTGK